MRHFLSLKDLEPQVILRLVGRAMTLKEMSRGPLKDTERPLDRRILAMLFTKRSTRTRVSAEAGWTLLGGHPSFFSQADVQLGAGEPIQDTARVLSSMTDAILARLGPHDDLLTLAKHSSVPVINALTDTFHPLQALADLQTICEAFATSKWSTERVTISNSDLAIVPQIKVAWVGDANNILNSLLVSLPRLGIRMGIATPKGYNPPQNILDFSYSTATKGPESIAIYQSPMDAVKDADVIMTDTWVSMGMEADKDKRLKDFDGFKITRKITDKARPDWRFMHCLPRKNEEVEDDVFYDPVRSLVWQEAENRKYTIMAVFEYVMEVKWIRKNS